MHIAYRLELSRIYEHVGIVNNIVDMDWALFSFYHAVALASRRGSLRIELNPFVCHQRATRVSLFFLDTDLPCVESKRTIVFSSVSRLEFNLRIHILQ